MARTEQAAPPAGTFATTRVFDAPRDQVWSAWSDAKQMEAWWGPKACQLKLHGFDFRPGGFFHYSMQFPNSPLMWGRFFYRQIEEPQRIAWLNSFSNEGCGITRAPFDASFPLELHNEVRFIERDGKTTLTLHARPHGATDNERAFFEGMFTSLEQGFGGTMDQLSRHLARARS